VRFHLDGALAAGRYGCLSGHIDQRLGPIDQFRFDGKEGLVGPRIANYYFHGKHRVLVLGIERGPGVEVADVQRSARYEADITVDAAHPLEILVLHVVAIAPSVDFQLPFSD